MRFTTAWAKTASLNVTLKWATVTLSVASLILTFGLLKVSLRKPLIIERKCNSQILDAVPATEPTQTEIEMFVREALPYRFDTVSVPNTEQISPEEMNFRFKEQDLFKQKQMGQKILVNKVEIKGSDILVEADRVISIGKAKSILPFPLKIEVKKTVRTDANPYGLILTTTTSAKVEGSEQ